MMAGFAGSLVIGSRPAEFTVSTHKYTEQFNRTVSAHTNRMSCKIHNFANPFYHFFETENIDMQKDNNI